MTNRAVARSRRERFRYVSGPLNGKWRWTYAEAVKDAIKAGQAVQAVAANGEITWLAGGRIDSETKPGSS